MEEPIEMIFFSTSVLKKRFIFNFVLNPPADIQFRTFTVFFFLNLFSFYFQFKHNKDVIIYLKRNTSRG